MTALYALFLLFALSIAPCRAAQPLSQDELAQAFKGYNAAFVVYNTNSGAYVRNDPAACAQRLSPCSTFKIFNALVGLESGVLRNENHPMLWDGTKFEIEEWNRDQTLQTAVTNSVVWYFRRVAAAVGTEKMKQYIHLGHYGNEDISGGITQFWLSSTLKISSDEQVELLKGLINDELPFSKRSMAITRGLIRLSQSDKGVLYGKTGTDRIVGKNVLGWFVGYVVQPGQTFVFATNIQSADGAWGRKAREITENILHKMQIF